MPLTATFFAVTRSSPSAAAGIGADDTLVRQRCHTVASIGMGWPRKLGPAARVPLTWRACFLPLVPRRLKNPLPKGCLGHQEGSAPRRHDPGALSSAGAWPDGQQRPPRVWIAAQPSRCNCGVRERHLPRRHSPDKPNNDARGKGHTFSLAALPGQLPDGSGHRRCRIRWEVPSRWASERGSWRVRAPTLPDSLNLQRIGQITRL